MSETNDADWTNDKRRLFGNEYSQYNTIEPEISETKDDNEWTISYHGKIKTPPEMMPVEVGPEVFVYGVLYDLDKFEVKNNQTGISSDLVKFTAGEWTQKIIGLSSPDYTAPELIDPFMATQFLDINKKECVVNSFLGPEGQTDTLVKIIIWNTLITHFTQEVGNPMNQEAFNNMKNQVSEKRQIILDVLKGKSPGEINEDSWTFVPNP